MRLSVKKGRFVQHDLKRNQLSGCIGTSPEGTAENSPGRQSWVYIRTATSPEGTAENAPGCQSWGTSTARECYWQSSKANPSSPAARPFFATWKAVPSARTSSANGNPHYFSRAPIALYKGVDGIAGLFFNKQITDGRQPSLISGHLHRAWHDFILSHIETRRCPGDPILRRD
jgi:hypothetical protein